LDLCSIKRLAALIRTFLNCGVDIGRILCFFGGFAEMARVTLLVKKGVLQAVGGGGAVVSVDY
jgi:hypothetical protein